jgi:hypothetical protein
MGWKRRWPEKIPRPKVRHLSGVEREQILGVFRQGIQASPVLTALGIHARALRGRFYFERVWPVSDERPEIEVIGRATAFEDAEKDLLLEVEKNKGNWYEFMRGTAEEVVGKIG